VSVDRRHLRKAGLAVAGGALVGLEPRSGRDVSTTAGPQVEDTHC
jgi:hypothetical protein